MTVRSARKHLFVGLTIRKNEAQRIKHLRRAEERGFWASGGSHPTAWPVERHTVLRPCLLVRRTHMLANCLIEDIQHGLPQGHNAFDAVVGVFEMLQACPQPACPRLASRPYRTERQCTSILLRFQLDIPACGWEYLTNQPSSTTRPRGRA